MSRINYRRYIGVLLSSLFLLWLASCPVRASTADVQIASSMTAVTDSEKSMPMISDCMPCALCYLASAPEAPTGFDEKYAITTATLWFAPITTVATAARTHTGGEYRRLPVRIVFCRWLN